MKPLKKLLVLCIMCTTTFIFSQELSEKQKQKDKDEVRVFTAEENDNLQLYYHEEVKKMKLSESMESSYFDILLYHVYDMNRLNDKDKDYSEEETREKFNEILSKMNAKMKTLLTPEQYVMHLESFNKIVYIVASKEGWD